MQDLDINGVGYRTGQLNAKQQFHIARRLAPVIARLGGVNNRDVLVAAAAQARENGEDTDEANGSTDMGAFMDMAQTLADAVAQLTDKDCDYIMGVCMGVVQRRQGDRFVPVWNKAVDQPQFADITLPALIQLTVAVIQDNMGSFMPAQLQPGQQAPMSPPTVQ